MKTKPFLSLSILSLLLAASPAIAQQGVAPRSIAPQPREPFLKERGAPPTAPDTSGAVTTMTSVFEVFTLPEADANELLLAPSDSPARYRRVSDLVKLGKARLETVAAVANRSDARAILDSMDQAAIPQEYLRMDRPGNPLVPSLQPMGFGDHLQFEGSLADEGRGCNLNVNLEIGRLLGFRPFHTAKDEPAQEGGMFEKRGVATSLIVRTGEHVLLGTMSRPPAALGRAAETSLAFVRVAINRDRPEAAEAAGNDIIGYLEQTVSVYSMERSAARELLAADHKPGEMYAAVQSSIKASQARLEHTIFLSSMPGVQASFNENSVVRAPAAVIPVLPETPAVPGVARPLPAPSAAKEAAPATLFTDKLPGLNVGLSGDLGCEVKTGDALTRSLPLMADVYANIWWRADLGLLQDGGKPFEDPERPALELRHLDGYFRCYANVPSFLGTLNPPRDTGVNGRKDEGRAWLCFIRVKPVRPYVGGPAKE
jgi:hypothetical protein